MSDGHLPDRVARSRTVRGSAAPAVIPPRVMASWQRSEGYGVSLDTIDPVFSGSVDEHSLFFECGNAVLGQLHATLANEPVSLILTDSEGLVLSRMSGDHELLRALDTVYLAPGFGFSEREAGTNGLALALADRVPTLVRADEHYCAGLFGFTCAAVPVNDPVSGQLVGSVNLSTWSEASSQLLLALAQSAASSTASLMLARSSGRTPHRTPRGEVFRVEPARLVADVGVVGLSNSWSAALKDVETALADGRVVAVVGEPGSGRASLLALAHRRVRPHDRILSASPPDPQVVDAWLSLWTPELAKSDTGIIVRDVDTLPTWAATRLREILSDVAKQTHSTPESGPVQPFAMTADDLRHVPGDLGSLVDTVVRIPSLRDRTGDIDPLAHHFAQQVRGHDMTFTPAAMRALSSYSWPGNVAQLRQVVRAASVQTDVIDIHHLPTEISGGPSHRLTRIESMERNEIVRCLVEPGVTVAKAAEQLGMSRATIYRKISQYDIKWTRRRPGQGS